MILLSDNSNAIALNLEHDSINVVVIRLYLDTVKDIKIKYTDHIFEVLVGGRIT